MKNKILIYIGSVIVLVASFYGFSELFKKNINDKISFLAKENFEVFVRDYSPRYGDKNAKVYLVEYLDPECESCRAFYHDVKTLLKKYEGKVQLVVRYAPFHKNSKIAIRALEATRKQGKYWESMEILFHYQPLWGNHRNPKPELIFDYLRSLKIDMAKLENDMKDPKIDEIIKQDMEDLKALNVRGTPTFFVNGKPLPSFGLEQLKSLLEREVKLQYGL